MWRQRFLAMGAPCVALALALFSTSEGLAEHGGGGHGGGHAGGGHAGGGEHGGGGWHSGSNGWHGAYSGGRGYGYGGYGYGIGLGWPGYWGGSSYGAYDGGYPYSNYPYTANYYSNATQTGYAEEADMPAMQRNIAHVRVLVPAGAKISFDGTDTEQTGTERVFVTPELQPGRSYKYEVRAHWMVGDKETTQTRQVTFHAGDGVTVTFMQ